MSNITSTLDFYLDEAEEVLQEPGQESALAAHLSKYAAPFGVAAEVIEPIGDNGYPLVTFTGTAEQLHALHLLYSGNDEAEATFLDSEAAAASGIDV